MKIASEVNALMQVLVSMAGLDPESLRRAHRGAPQIVAPRLASASGLTNLDFLFMICSND